MWETSWQTTEAVEDNEAGQFLAKSLEKRLKGHNKNCSTKNSKMLEKLPM